MFPCECKISLQVVAEYLLSIATLRIEPATAHLKSRCRKKKSLQNPLKETKRVHLPM